jgi:hypothetical protein
MSDPTEACRIGRPRNFAACTASAVSPAYLRDSGFSLLRERIDCLDLETHQLLGLQLTSRYLETGIAVPLWVLRDDPLFDEQPPKHGLIAGPRRRSYSDGGKSLVSELGLPYNLSSRMKRPDARQFFLARRVAMKAVMKALFSLICFLLVRSNAGSQSPRQARIWR